MRIRTRLIALSWGAAVLAVLAVSVYFWTAGQVTRAGARQDLAREMLETAQKRTALRDEYLQYHDERPREQWWRQTEKMRGLTQRADAAFVSPEQRLVLRQVSLNLDKATSIFTRLLENRDGMVKGVIDSVQGEEIERRNYSQLIISSQSFITEIFKLQELSGREYAAVQARYNAVILVSVLLLAGFTMAGTMVVARGIAVPLLRLKDGIEVIATGNLDAQVSIGSRDEIGELAASFNQMTARLKTITVSRDELATEVENRKRAEAQLKKAVLDLERSNKELEQFAYVASHDLQEPLRMVSSYTQLLAQRYEGLLDDKARKYIDYAVDGAVRMQRLINDLLTFSRVGTRGRPAEPTDAHAALGEAIVNLSAAIEENGAIVTTDDLPTVLADATQLVQVFQNLVANAIKFRGEAAPRVHVSARDQGSEWVFSVRDNGIGIEPQHRNRLFVIFQRLHTRDEYPGTGIGLAVCKRIVERHGGTIWFESEPGSGATFFFTFPKPEGRHET
jgi:signal transduction histidine kinase